MMREEEGPGSKFERPLRQCNINWGGAHVSSRSQKAEEIFDPPVLTMAFMMNLKIFTPLTKFVDDVVEADYYNRRSLRSIKKDRRVCVEREQ